MSDDMVSNNPLSSPNALRIPFKPKKQNDNDTNKKTKSSKTKSEELVFEAPERKNPDQRAFFPEYAPIVKLTTFRINPHVPRISKIRERTILGLNKESFHSSASSLINYCELPFSYNDYQ